MRKVNSVGASMIYKTMERYTTLAFQLIVQIIIARILSPDDYGIVAMMAVFISVANIFINNGFNVAVIQKKEIDSNDFPTALTLNMLIGLFLYLVLFIFSPAIASFYHTDDLSKALRVLALILPMGSVSSILSAIATRTMNFSALFVCNVIGSLASGIIGVIMAYIGFGYWALIGQQFSSVTITTIALIIVSNWKPHFGYNSNSAKSMFSFGSKLLAAGLINQIYTQLSSLIIGRKYVSADLAFYTKGKLFPSYITTGLDGALQTVSLSVFSKNQNEKKELHAMMTKFLQTYTFFSFPILIFIFVAGNQIVELLLTDKWLPSVVFMRIACITYIFLPISSIGAQAIAAVGRSDVRLKLEFINKPIGLIFLFIFMSKGAQGIAVGAMIAQLIAIIISFFVIKKILDYDVFRIIKNILPSLLISVVMGLGIQILISFLVDCHLLIQLVVEMLTAAAIYLLLSYLFKVKGITLVQEKIKLSRKCKRL